MKFSCDRCGKKYATAEMPAPGRVYKIKCKACGHVIVVKASAGSPASASTEMRPPTLTGIAAAQPTRTPPPLHAASTPDVQLEIAPPEPAAAPPPPPGDETQEISMAGLSASPADPGYVDLFADTAKPEPEAEQPQDDPFLAAARASLPETYGASPPASDPFGPLLDEYSTPPPPPSARPPSATSSTLPKIPVIPKPAQNKSNLPWILIGAGGLVLLGILAFVLLGGKGAPPSPTRAQAPVSAPVAQPQPSAAPQPVAPQLAAPPAPVAAVPVSAAPAAAPQPPPKADKAADKRAAEDDRRARDDRKQRDRDAKEARDREARETKDREKAAREAKARQDREAKDRDKAAREQKARDDREAKQRERERREADKVAAAAMADDDGGLSQAVIEKVLASTRKAFEGCIVASGKSGEVKLDGRRVMLRLNIQNTGAVTYPTLDDVTLNGTELGSCLKSAARLMVFPKFKSDTMHVEVPLVLAGR